MYRSGSRPASAWLTALYAACTLLFGVEWIYGGAAAHQGPGDYYTSLVALLFECVPYALAGFAASYAWKLPPIEWSITIAGLWTLCEYWRATSPIGIPYVQMGHALIDTPLVVLARLGGTEALTFLCVLIAAMLVECSTRAPRMRVIAWTLLAMFIAANALLQGPKTATAASGARVSVFQLWVVDNDTIPRYLGALRTLPPASGLAIWPESYFDLSRLDIVHVIQSTALEHHVALLVGGAATDASGIHDALVLVGRDGLMRGYYAKRRLVPFGEYLPLPTLAHVLIPATLLSGVPRISPGSGPVTFDAGGRKIGPLICYESAYPSLARDEVRRGANLLVAATNDAWFTQTSGIWELEQTARLVAIETGTPLVLSGTVGPSGVIDADGRWTGSLPVGTARRAEFLAPLAHATIYDATGDFPWIAIAIAVVGFGFLRLVTRPLARRVPRPMLGTA